MKKTFLYFILLAVLVLPSLAGAQGTKISNLPDGSSGISGTDVFPIVRAGNNYKVTITSLLGLIPTFGTLTNGDYCTYSLSGNVINCNSSGGSGSITGAGTNYYLSYWSSANSLGQLASLGSSGAFLMSNGAGALPGFSTTTLTDGSNGFTITNGTGSLTLGSGKTLSFSGTFTDGDFCTYASTGNVISCNSVGGGSVTGSGTQYYLPVWTATGVLGKLASAGTAGNPVISGGGSANPSYLGIVLAGGTNTFSITNGSAEMSVAAGINVNFSGTFTDGDVCTYTASTHMISCNTLSGGGNVSNVGTPTNYQWGIYTGATSLKGLSVTVSSVVITDANGQPTTSATTPTELGYVHNVTSAIQTQLGTKAIGPGASTANHVAIFANTDGITLADGGTGHTDLQTTPGSGNNVSCLNSAGAEVTCTIPDVLPISSPITGFSSGAGTVSATDTILQALNKIVGNIAALPVMPSSTDGDILYGLSGWQKGTALPNGITATTQTSHSNDIKVATDAYVDGDFTITGSSLTAGSAYYMGASALALAKADSASTLPAICVAVSTTSCRVVGQYTTSGLTRGNIFYVSDATAGLLTTTAPSTVGHFVQRVGVATSTTSLLIMPSLDVGGL